MSAFSDQPTQLINTLILLFINNIINQMVRLSIGNLTTVRSLLEVIYVLWDRDLSK